MMLETRFYFVSLIFCLSITLSLSPSLAMNNDGSQASVTLSTASVQSSADAMAVNSSNQDSHEAKQSDAELKKLSIDAKVQRQKLLSDVQFFYKAMTNQKDITQRKIALWQSWAEQTIKKALDTGADVTVTSDTNGTFLFYAVSMGLSVTIIQKLVQAGASVNVQETAQKLTPLHVAIVMKAIDYLKLLLKAETVNLELKDENGSTPLHLACQQITIDILNDGYPDATTYDMIYLLVKAGARLDTLDWQANTPLEYVPDLFKQDVEDEIDRARKASNLTLPMIREIDEGSE